MKQIKCFVCEYENDKAEMYLNEIVNMYACRNCTGTTREKKKVEELMDSLAEDLICGCI